MPGHDFYQPLRNRSGFTLIELFLSLAMAMILVMVVAGLFSVGEKSFNYSTRQTTVLANARQALDAGSSKPGMAAQARSAEFSNAVSTAPLTLILASGATSQFSLSGQNLILTQSTHTYTLAKNITALQAAYFNMNASGLIMVSTQASAASLVTAWIQSQQTGGKTYTFYSGGRLRNHL